MATLLDDAGQLATPALLSGAAATLGEPEQSVARGMNAGMTSLFAGLVNKTADPSALQQIFSLATDPANDGSILENPAGLVDSISGGARSPIVVLGERFTSATFGGRSAAVNDVIARSSGLRAGAVASIFRLAAPLVLGLIGRRVRDAGLDAAGFASLLRNERSSILNAAPPGLTEALRPEREVTLKAERLRDTTEREPAARTRTGAPVTEAPVTEAPVAEEHRKRKVWPLVAALGVFALIWAFWPRSNRTEEEVVVAPVVGATSTIGGEVAPSPLTSRLPNGEDLNLRENGMESQLLVFIRDPARTARDTTWFEFDQLTFDSNSSNLSAESNEQLRNVSRILQAYPNVALKIGAFTDTVGDAKANQRLSQQRAYAVRAALVSSGVNGKRLKAEGYGEKHPAADNRRVALLVTKK